MLRPRAMREATLVKLPDPSGEAIASLPCLRLRLTQSLVAGRDRRGLRVHAHPWRAAAPRRCAAVRPSGEASKCTPA